MTLNRKFQLASSAMILVVVIGMMVSLYHSEKKLILWDIQQKQLADLSKLESVYEQAYLMGNDEITLLHFVKSLIESPVVAYVGWYSASNTGAYSKYTQFGLVQADANRPHIRQILSSKSLLRSHLMDNDIRVLELAKPMKNRGFISLGYSEEVLDAIFQDTLWNKQQRILVVGLIAILFGLALSTLLGVALSKPIKLLMHAAEAIAMGEKDVRLKVSGGDELGKLMETFNMMSSELAKLDQLKDDFMAHVTHELRSPLTSIIATVELMEENPLVVKDAKLKRSVERLNYGSERLNKLVDNILDLMRMKAGKMHFEIQPVGLPNLLKEMADFFVPRAQEKGLTIKAKVPKDFPLVMADSERVRQVLSNLIYNAIKFTNKGGITLWLRAQGPMVEVGVEDTGVGIPQDQISRLFRKFETLKDTRNRVDKPLPGSGLGLNIVLSSITAQGGTVRVESEIDKGSTFIFTLPLAPKDAQLKYASAPSSAQNALISPI